MKYKKGDIIWFPGPYAHYIGRKYLYCGPAKILDTELYSESGGYSVMFPVRIVCENGHFIKEVHNMYEAELKQAGAEVLK